jgi:hypothetical protein
VTRIEDEFIMKKLRNFLALTAAMAMLANSGYSQETYYDDACCAYSEGSGISYTAIIIPVAALAIAGIIIASTDRHHHHHSSSDPSSSSHSHSHSH